MFKDNVKPFWIILLCGIAVWIVMMAFNPGGEQSHIFASGNGIMGDFLYPKLCSTIKPYYSGVSNETVFSEMKARNGWTDRRLVPLAKKMNRCEWEDGFPARLDTITCCYPAVCLALVAPFPLSHSGSIACTLLGLSLFLAALLLFTRSPWILLSVLFSSAVLFGVSCGQLIFYSAAGVTVFLAWWDSESRAKRTIAALALAFAAATKLSPALFGALYLTRGRWWRSPEPWIAGITAIVLVFLPFVFYGGMDAFFRWTANAAENGTVYTRSGRWGILAVERTLKIAFGFNVHSPWPEMKYFRAIDFILGIFCLWRGWRTASAFLITSAMMLLPGNMLYYTGIYLIPALLIDNGFKSTRFRYPALILAFFLLTPLQIPPYGISFTVADCAFLGLILIRVLEPRAGTD